VDPCRRERKGRNWGELPGMERRWGDLKSPFLPNRKKQLCVLRIWGCQKIAWLCCVGSHAGTLRGGELICPAIRISNGSLNRLASLGRLKCKEGF
jgi:hypothetical protein